MRVGGPGGEFCSNHALRGTSKRRLSSEIEHGLPKATILHSLRDHDLGRSQKRIGVLAASRVHPPHNADATPPRATLEFAARATDLAPRASSPRRVLEATIFHLGRPHPPHP